MGYPLMTGLYISYNHCLLSLFIKVLWQLFNSSRLNKNKWSLSDYNQQTFLFPECVIIVHAVAGTDSAHLLRRYEEKDERKGFWGGAQAAMPTALGYVSIGLACGDYRCALCDTC